MDQMGDLETRPGASYGAANMWRGDVREGNDMAPGLNGRVAIVTGAAHGIGQAIWVGVACGGGGQRMKPVEEGSDEEWRRLFAINLDGAFHFTRAVAPHMKARGSGSIVNISSGAGRSYRLTGIPASRGR